MRSLMVLLRMTVVIAVAVTAADKSAPADWSSARSLKELELSAQNMDNLKNGIYQNGAVSYDLGTPNYEILNPDDLPEIITPDHPHYLENLRRIEESGIAAHHDYTEPERKRGLPKPNSPSADRPGSGGNATSKATAASDRRSEPTKLEERQVPPEAIPPRDDASKREPSKKEASPPKTDGQEVKFIIMKRKDETVAQSPKTKAQRLAKRPKPSGKPRGANERNPLQEPDFGDAHKDSRYIADEAKDRRYKFRIPIEEERTAPSLETYLKESSPQMPSIAPISSMAAFTPISPITPIPPIAPITLIPPVAPITPIAPITSLPTDPFEAIRSDGGGEQSHFLPLQRGELKRIASYNWNVNRDISQSPLVRNLDRWYRSPDQPRPT